MDNPAQYIRASRQLTVCHGEAFQLMLYEAKYDQRGEGAERKIVPIEAQRVWIWNSRDGVTPFGCTIDGLEYTHAMNSYRPTYSAVLPPEASHVFVDYNRDEWRAMLWKRWENMKDHPATEFHDPAKFIERFPHAEAFEEVQEFEFGSPLRLTRAEFLGRTTSWMGKP